jgi:hypothetical protein
LNPRYSRTGQRATARFGIVIHRSEDTIKKPNNGLSLLKPDGFVIT